MKLIAAVAVALLAAGCGGDEKRSSEPPPASTRTAEPSTPTKTGGVVVQLREQNGSGESGTATIVGWPKKAEIFVELNGAPSTAQPAHIHIGSCDRLDVPRYKINDVVDGKSYTDLGRLDRLPGDEDVEYAINVHESYDEIDTYVACGDLP
jgi:hypothetical protein